MSFYAGTQLVTADALIGAATKATRVFSIHIISGGTAGVVLLRNGQAVSGTTYVSKTGTISVGVTENFGESGYFFPAGCFCDIDANVTSCLVSYSQV